MKRRTANTFAVILCLAGTARAQVAPNGPGIGNPYGTQYQARQQAIPVAPRNDSRPANWPGGPGSAEAPAAAQAFSPEEFDGVWRKNPLPEKFIGTEVIARVGTEVILASDVLTNVEETVQRAIASGQLPESRAKELRYHLMRQALSQLIDTKMLLIEARREIPKENMVKIEAKVKEIYDKEQIPKLIDGKRIKSRAELIQLMKQAGTNIQDQQRKFLESSLAAQYANKKFGDDKEITHQRMLAYYQEHSQDYDIDPRARWEHVMVRFSNYPSKADAYAKIAGWGNEIISGVPLADVARKHSDDLTSEIGRPARLDDTRIPCFRYARSGNFHTAGGTTKPAVGGRTRIPHRPRFRARREVKSSIWRSSSGDQEENQRGKRRRSASRVYCGASQGDADLDHLRRSARSRRQTCQRSIAAPENRSAFAAVSANHVTRWQSPAEVREGSFYFFQKDMKNSTSTVEISRRPKSMTMLRTILAKYGSAA